MDEAALPLAPSHCSTAACVLPCLRGVVGECQHVWLWCEHIHLARASEIQFLLRVLCTLTSASEAKQPQQHIRRKSRGRQQKAVLTCGALASLTEGYEIPLLQLPAARGQSAIALC